mmetsp:Transcript_5637/g.7525  ORF Transcript_5637/g.7525 Transcript_5637/m.7525 type:complete len:208 (+) Transcript_5637:1-624(+)
MGASPNENSAAIAAPKSKSRPKGDGRSVMATSGASTPESPRMAATGEGGAAAITEGAAAEGATAIGAGALTARPRLRGTATSASMSSSSWNAEGVAAGAEAAATTTATPVIIWLISASRPTAGAATGRRGGGARTRLGGGRAARGLGSLEAIMKGAVSTSSVAAGDLPMAKMSLKGEKPCAMETGSSLRWTRISKTPRFVKEYSKVA